MTGWLGGDVSHRITNGVRGRTLIHSPESVAKRDSLLQAGVLWLEEWKGDLSKEDQKGISTERVL